MRYVCQWATEKVSGRLFKTSVRLPLTVKVGGSWPCLVNKHIRLLSRALIIAFTFGAFGTYPLWLTEVHYGLIQKKKNLLASTVRSGCKKAHAADIITQKPA